MSFPEREPRERGQIVGRVIVEENVPVLPAGVYPASFEGVEQMNNDNGVFWLWRFIARSGNNDVEITATTSPRITPRTKAAKFLTGLGVNVGVGETVDFDELAPMVCTIVVEINENNYSRITSVLPYMDEKAPTRKK